MEQFNKDNGLNREAEKMDSKTQEEAAGAQSEIDNSTNGWVFLNNIENPILSLIIKTLSIFASLPSYILPVLTNKDKFKVGIVTNSNECELMEKLLRSGEFKAVDDVVVICPSKDGEEAAKQILTCSCIIIYYAGQIIVDPKQITEVENVYPPLEIKKNVILVVEEFKDRESKENVKMLNDYVKRTLGSELISFTSREIQWCKQNHSLFKTGKLEQIKVIMNKGLSRRTYHKFVVEIFSRSSGTDYNWLTTHLKSEAFHNLVEDVRPFYISNSNGQQFRNTVAECDFGILYHSKKRGRVNVTDVTDSLYDYELKYMSDSLDKENLIVVIDDLDDSSAEVKDRILQSQNSIRELATDLILFTVKERDPNYREPSPDSKEEESFNKKLEMLKQMVEKDRESVTDDSSEEWVLVNTIGSSLISFFSWLGSTLSSLVLLPSYVLSMLTSKEKFVVGIVTNSLDCDWMEKLLRFDNFNALVDDVITICLSRDGDEIAKQKVSTCSCIILYYTGQIIKAPNDPEITEVENLFLMPGKENIIVVIDDLDDSSVEEKDRILQSQTSIWKLAAGLILFTEKERDPNYREPSPTTDSKEEKSLNRKLKMLNQLVEKAKSEKGLWNVNSLKINDT